MVDLRTGSVTATGGDAAWAALAEAVARDVNTGKATAKETFDGSMHRTS